ncbi:hypothetical protein A986_04691 [Pseudomonas fluorescens BRIP34879]|uniref:Uncharacterized protein n=1 Tax=Pseudomonas poae TaxID=200451 RepID=A0AAP2RYR6_9PSED|nr:hypothetical protein A986_04691 [Pseudomonas fluorescens BRIP34879]KRP50835.1 hypothetical protein TU75_11585 [Pseudomonas poae]MCF5653625.1 hypothetical protein [Pseudomonas poae]
MQFRVVTDALQQLTLIATIFDRATERHAALVFLLTTGFDGAAAFFVVPGHFESPNASTGSTGWAQGMTVWRRGDDRKMNLPASMQINCGSWLACDADNSVYPSNRGDAIAGKPAPTC